MKSLCLFSLLLMLELLDTHKAQANRFLCDLPHARRRRRRETEPWHYPIIAASTVLGFIPTSKYLTGDISGYLPAVIFEDGKDNFIWISIFATFLVPLVAVSVAILLADRTWRRVRRGRG